MTKYVTFFTYTSDAWTRMIQNPGDRSATLRQLAGSVDVSVDCMYWMFGTYDGFVILDAPDSIGAAALSAAVQSTGVVKTLETHELLTQEQFSEALSRSKGRDTGLPVTRPAKQRFAARFRAWPLAWPLPSGPPGSAETPLDFDCQAAPGSFTRCDQAVASS